MRFAGRAYPAGDPVRDSAHLGLLERLRERLGPGLSWRTEVPLPIPGDLRAWDAQIVNGSAAVAVEAEVRLTDIQALDRRIALKRRDGDIDVVILLIGDTKVNRAVIAAHRSALRPAFPLDARGVLGALAAGKLPPTGGVVLL